MSSMDWNTLNKPEREKLLKSVGLPAILSQLRWGSLTKTQRSKIEKSSKKGKGWHEQKEDVVTEKGTEQKAPVHRKVALQKVSQEAINEPIETEKDDITMIPCTITGAGCGTWIRDIRGGVAAFRCGDKVKGELQLHPECKKEGHKQEETTVGLDLLKEKKPKRKHSQPEIITKTPSGIQVGGYITHKTAGYVAKVEKLYKNRGGDIDVVEAKSTPEWEKSIKEGFPIKIHVKEIDTYFTANKEPPTLSDPQRKTYDPAFEQSEDERMMNERKREEGTYEDIVVPYDTGDIGEMRAEAGIDETYRKLPEDWFTANRQKEWETHEVEGYGGRIEKPADVDVPEGFWYQDVFDKETFRKLKEIDDLTKYSPEQLREIYLDLSQRSERLHRNSPMYSQITEKQNEILKLWRMLEKQKEEPAQQGAKHFMTKLRDIDDRNKKACYEKTPVKKPYPFSYKGMNFFAHKEGKEWRVTEATTGIQLAAAHQFKGKWRNNTKDEIIQTAKEFIDEKTPEKVAELLKYAFDDISRTGVCQ